jgi:hypothetical protein
MVVVVVVCVAASGAPSLPLMPGLDWIGLDWTGLDVAEQSYHGPGSSLPPKQRRVYGKLVFCLVAFALNLLPYIAVSRSAFLYHFMPALMYAQIVAALYIDHVAAGRRRQVFRACVAAAAVSYLYFCPWIYALPMSTGAWGAPAPASLRLLLLAAVVAVRVGRWSLDGVWCGCVLQLVRCPRVAAL